MVVVAGHRANRAISGCDYLTLVTTITSGAHSQEIVSLGAAHTHAYRLFTHYIPTTRGVRTRLIGPGAGDTSFST